MRMSIEARLGSFITNSNPNSNSNSNPQSVPLFDFAHLDLLYQSLTHSADEHRPQRFSLFEFRAISLIVCCRIVPESGFFVPAHHCANAPPRA